MRGASSRDVLRHLNTLFHCGTTGQQSDAELLERFAAGCGETAEAAFAALVERHGNMVLGVCQRVLGNRDAAEDAFQATFLVLARRAASIARREQVANWLYGVALRAALDARGRAARRKAREKRYAAMLPVEMPDSSVACDARLVLDEELARLSERYRAAIVLCELEGLSRRQAAAQLGISEGTLSSRLARAKMQLKDRLTRRGLALSSVALAALLAQDALAVAVRPGLAESTIQLATLVSSGSSLAGIVSAPVATLTEGVLKAMLIAKMKSVFLGITTLALVTTGVGVLAQTAGPGPSPDDRLKAVERKLDRLLEVLGGANRSAPVLAAQPANVPTAATPAVPEFVPPPAHSAVSPSPGMPPTPFVKWKPTTPSALAPRVVQGRPAAVADVPTPVGGNQRPRGSAARSNPNRAQSLAGRVEAVEHRIGEIERRLAALERRLEQHSGGAAVPGSSSPLFYPTPAPPAPPSAPAKAVVPGLPANPSSDAAPTAPPTEAGPAAGVPNSNPTPPVPVGDQPTTPPSDELSPDRPQK